MLAYLQERFERPTVKQPRPLSFCDAPAEVLDRARDEALSSLGEGTVEDPTFGCLFRPLDAEYAQLSADKQLNVHRLLEAYYRVAARAGAYSAKLDSYKNLLAKTGEVLSTGEHDEFMVRASPLAKAIRRMNLELDETRYRALVDIVAKDERLSQRILGNIDASQSAAFHNARIAALLGSENYVRFAYRVDPLGAGTPLGKLGKRLARELPAAGRSEPISN